MGWMTRQKKGVCVVTRENLSGPGDMMAMMGSGQSADGV